MQINLIPFSSTLHQSTSVRLSHEELFNELNKYFTIKLYSPDNLSKLSPADFTILFIATGGVEREVIKHFEKLPRPLILLADGLQNSLPATIEISSWIRHQGFKCEILYGEKSHIINRLQILVNCFKAQRSIVGTRIGVIGTPSAWLVASGVDYLLAKRRWGIEYVDIQLEEVYTRYEKTSANEVEEETTNLVSRAYQYKECTLADLIKAMRLYHAIRRLCDDYKLKAITLSCFSILEKLSVSGCLALSLLNDEGIVAGCEGDLQAIFSMIVAKAVTGHSGFMANPCMVDCSKNEVVFAHCTIGTALVEKFILRSHYESNKSVGIQGLLPIGDVSVVRCGGECLDEYYFSSGKLIENTNFEDNCRTQIRVNLDSPVDYFLNNPLGNHHIVIPYSSADYLNEFFQSNNCKRIE